MRSCARKATRKASFKAKFPVLQELFAKNHRGDLWAPPAGRRLTQHRRLWTVSRWRPTVRTFRRLLADLVLYIYGYRHLFSIGGQILTFMRKFYEGKKSNFGRWVFIFVLPIRNKSHFSGKIITSLKIERMSLNVLAIWPKHKIEMQIIYDGKYV